jgi:hypothetical protein
VSPSVYGMVFLLGAGSLALWSYLRWPGLMPSRLTRILVHIALAILASQLGREAIELLASLNSVGFSLAAVFGIALPLLTYNLLVALWVLALLAGLRSGVR